MMLLLIGWFVVIFEIVGWTLLTTTSASLLIPHKAPTYDRIAYVLFGSHDGDDNTLRMRLRMFKRLLIHFSIILPTTAHWWMIDELLYGDQYRNEQIIQPVIALTAPRSGSTSFHRTLALDDEHYVTPKLVDILFPYIWMHKLMEYVRMHYPAIASKIGNRFSRRLEETVWGKFHEFAWKDPEVDESLNAEWHWIGVQSLAHFPVARYWYKNCKWIDKDDKNRTNLFVDAFYKKVLHMNSLSCSSTITKRRKLLVRSHRSDWVDEFATMYPDAVFVGIVRDPVSMIRSLGTFMHELLKDQEGVHVFGQGGNGMASFAVDSNGHSIIKTAKEESGSVEEKEDYEADDEDPRLFPGALVAIVANLLGAEAAIFGNREDQKHPSPPPPPWSTNGGSSLRVEELQQQWHPPRGHYVTFSNFKADPVKAISDLYMECGLSMTTKYENAIRQSLKAHTSYKDRYAYKNLTLREMSIDEEKLSNIPHVQQYAKLLQA